MSISRIKSIQDSYANLTLYRLVMVFLCLFILNTSIRYSAQQDDQTQFPTLTHLNESIIPPADRVELAHRFYQVDLSTIETEIKTDYAVGDVAQFRVLNSEEYRTLDINAELLAIGEHIAIWVDTGVKVSTREAQELARLFDTTIYDKSRQLWGEEANPGIDGDPRIHALFVEDIGPYVVAYYDSDHAYPREIVPHSNEREMMVYNLRQTGPNIANPLIESVTAHEFQHLIRDNMPTDGASWMDEGFSMFTEAYLGYERVIEEANAYLRAFDIQLNTWPDDAPSTPYYGASMLFITYFFEQYGIDALNALSQDTRGGLNAVDRVTRASDGRSVDALFADWALANLIQDTTIADGRYGYRLFTDQLIPPAMTDIIRTYPYQFSTQAPPYSVEYYRVETLPESGVLAVNLGLSMDTELLPTRAPEGEYFWYSNRADRSNMRLTRAFDLSGVESATLTYDIWFDNEIFWDYGYVTISADNGETWNVLLTDAMDSDNYTFNGYAPGYTGQSNGWIQERIDLSAYVGGEVLLRFELLTDAAINRYGMALDNIAIAEIDYRDTVEIPDNGWLAGGWIRSDNRLPQDAWLQVVQFTPDDVLIERVLWSEQDHLSVQLNEATEAVYIVVSKAAQLTTVPTHHSISVRDGAG